MATAIAFSPENGPCHATVIGHQPFDFKNSIDFGETCSYGKGHPHRVKDGLSPAARAPVNDEQSDNAATMATARSARRTYK
ncbi:MAG: hypothetical protein NVS3B16_05960 [Vulcanimicrobiaceae bacterium]